MKPNAQASFATGPPHVTYFHRVTVSRAVPSQTHLPPPNQKLRQFRTAKRRRVNLSITAAQKTEHHDGNNGVERTECSPARSNRRGVLLAPFLAAGASFLLSAETTRAAEEEEKLKENTAPIEATVVKPEEVKKIEEEVITSRIYDATAIGEPLAIGKEKGKVWEKLMNARVVYLGEAEQVPVRDDKELELEIVKNLHKRCVDVDKRLSLAIEAFPADLQEPLNQYMDKKMDGETLKSYTTHWPPERWQEYGPILSYCRENGIRLVACGTPLKILRTVQAEGISGLTKAERKLYAPPAGSGFISGFSSMSRRYSADSTPNLSFPFGPSSYLSAQARVVDEYTMSQIILQNMLDAGATGMLIVVTGASHVTYGARGTGVPARISRKLQKKNQVVILLDPERQFIRSEGEVPVADFLWYSAARPCSRNCFDRVEIARVMNAAGQRRDALPQDLQKGIDLGLVSPEVLQNFFDLEKYPLLSELTHRFQGFRERLLADPKFLQRLAIEEGISVTTTLLAQYQKRKENFFQELDYVITDTVRGSVVDFFTVWLPAPTLSFLSYADETIAPDNVSSLIGLLGSIPDNAFQKNPVGTNWNLNHRIASVVFGGLKLAGVGFISSIGAVASSNSLFAVRKFLNPAIITNKQIARSPILKTAVVYALFLGISANLRYQIIAGVVEHRISDQFASQTFLVNMLSFVSRTINSYWGTQQWIDLARSTGLQVRKTESPEPPTSDSPNQAAILYNSTGPQVTKTESPEPPSSDSPNQAAILCNEAEEASIDEIKSE